MTNKEAKELLSSVKLSIKWITFDGARFCELSDGPNYLTTISKEELIAILQLAPKETK